MNTPLCWQSRRDPTPGNMRDNAGRSTEAHEIVRVRTHGGDRFVSVAAGAVSGVASTLGYSESDTERLRSLVDALCRDVIHHHFDQPAEADFTVIVGERCGGCRRTSSVLPTIPPLQSWSSTESVLHRSRGKSHHHRRRTDPQASTHSRPRTGNERKRDPCRPAAGLRRRGRLSGARHPGAFGPRKRKQPGRRKARQEARRATLVARRAP